MPTSTTHDETRTESAGEGFESTGLSSLDTTCSEVCDQISAKRTQDAPQSKKMKKEEQMHQKEVPMREEFLAKIGWTRSFISGTADPLHNPHMVWCHI